MCISGMYIPLYVCEASARLGWYHLRAHELVWQPEHSNVSSAGSHIHCRAVQFRQGRVGSSSVHSGCVPLQLEDIWLAEQVQQDAPLKPACSMYDSSLHACKHGAECKRHICAGMQQHCSPALMGSVQDITMHARTHRVW